jgi:ferredoxin-NADP reductase
MSMRLKISKKLLKAFVSPAQFDFWSREVGSTVAWDRCLARIVALTHENPNTVSLKLKPNSNFSGFVAGQHVNVTAEIKGVRTTRCYSITNTPSDKTLDLTIRAEPRGVMSSWLTHTAKRGTVVELGRVFGELSLPTDVDSPLVLLAAGSGITPMMSLIRQAEASSYPQAITLLYWEKTPDNFCFNDELDAIHAGSSPIQIHKITTQDQSTGLTGGRISDVQISQLLPNIHESQVYACGSSGFAVAAKSIVEPVAKSFAAEAFTPSTIVSPPEQETQFEVELLKSGRTITVSNQANLLDALEAEGIAVESGCRMGICDTCTCQKSKGTTLNIESGQLNAEQSSPIRLCVSRAVQNLQLEL